MESPVAVYLEVGSRRVFAGALDWPCWCRSGRDEDVALQALVAYSPRYEAAIGPVARGFNAPTDPSSLEVCERVVGNATTDFGAPAVAPAVDEWPLDEGELQRLSGLLQSCWTKFDAAAEAAHGVVLRKGPRGGGRELEAIVSHVFEADRAYLGRLGARYRNVGDADVTVEMPRLRSVILAALSSRAQGEPLTDPVRSATLWTPRFFVRRSAWHALDHAWEIGDRATTTADGPT